jgi:redox-sensitive bicupin YhaK (pirin superfamily)
VGWIHQDAWFQTLDLEKHAFEYKMRRPGNGLYLFVIEGDVSVAGHELSRRDGIGVWDTANVGIEAKGKAKLLLIDVPM